MVIPNRFMSPGAAVAAAAQPDRTTTPARLGTSNMSLSLPAGAFIATPARNPAANSNHGSRISTTVLSALHLASYYQQHLGRVLFSLLFRASLFASGLLYLCQSAAVQAFQAARNIVSHSIRLSKQATWRLWDGTHGRRLRKKIEFEFFTLILGDGGNNLCLVIFWPGWGVLAMACLMISAWYAI